MEFKEVVQLLRRHNAFPLSRNSMNSVRIHSNLFESFRHFQIKAMLCWVIRRRGDNFFTEFVIANRKFDILQVKKKELVGWELETNKAIKKDGINGISCFTVYIGDVPDSSKEMEKYLRTLVF